MLTAGHCVVGSPASLKIRAGSTFVDRSGSLHQVDAITLHEDYGFKYGSPVNDVALFHVVEPFEFDDTRQPIELFDEESGDGVESVLTGWGSTNTHGGSPDRLQAVTVHIIGKSRCNEAYEKLMCGLPEGQICAGEYGVGGKDHCYGDSGGPMTIDGRLAGIVSWGEGCAEPYYPGVCTEIAHFRGWINAHLEI